MAGFVDEVDFAVDRVKVAIADQHAHVEQVCLQIFVASWLGEGEEVRRLALLLRDQVAGADDEESS